MNFSNIKNKFEDLYSINSHQIIFYGAPGTGKSHKIKTELQSQKVPKQNIFRTTFHPDSDYSTFVGAYKPTRSQKPVYGLFGDKTIRLNDGGDLNEEIITYKFIPQAFLKAYVRAYQVPTENVYLVIEEINRGNCAQIFGDLFQLLDRDENGKSEYTIKADDDLKTFLEEEFKRLGVGNDGIKDGELSLPSNLFIYATMNTSDQSLFPIDSAFKRRWDWEYEPIKYNNEDWIIKIDDNHRYKWVDFQKEVNNRILNDTSSEDKMLGDYFVNPIDKVINISMLLNKILFYLWNDVCKDGEGDIFKISDNQDVTFSELYRDNEKIIQMMQYLNIDVITFPNSEEQSYDDGDENLDNVIETSNSRWPKYSINDSNKLYTTPKVVKKVIEDYANLHNDISVDEMIKLWNDISERKDCLIDKWEPSPNDNQKFADKRRVEITWGNNSVWLINGWTEFLFNIFARNVKERLGIDIKRVE